LLTFALKIVDIRLRMPMRVLRAQARGRGVRFKRAPAG
jgi:hypothetical protein